MMLAGQFVWPRAGNAIDAIFRSGFTGARNDVCNKKQHLWKIF
jgi:hypothetical protein